MTFTNDSGDPGWENPTFTGGLRLPAQTPPYEFGDLPSNRWLYSNEVYFYENNDRFYIRRGGYNSVGINGGYNSVGINGDYNAETGNVDFLVIGTDPDQTFTVSGTPATPPSTLDLGTCTVSSGGESGNWCTTNTPKITVTYDDNDTSSVNLRIWGRKPSYNPASIKRASNGGHIGIPGWRSSVRTITFSRNGYEDVKVDFSVDYRNDLDPPLHGSRFVLSAWERDY